MKLLTPSSTAPGPAPAVPDPVLAAYEAFEKSAKDWLLARVQDLDPYKFESLVVDLLLAMKYGVRGTVTKKSGDSGIDGIIYEDKLGFTEILVQAKQWKNTVGRPEVQAFVGAIEQRKAKKGVILTTSHFSQQARDYVVTLSVRVVLIDGWQLADLMYQHNVGILEVGTLPLKQVSCQYFDNLKG